MSKKVRVKDIANKKLPMLSELKPDEFIPQIEGTHHMISLGRKVQTMACQHIQSWIARGERDLRVSINVSALSGSPAMTASSPALR